MKKNVILILLFMCSFASGLNARSTHKTNFFDIVRSSDSVVLAKVVSGNFCSKELDCDSPNQKKYIFTQIKNISGKKVVVDNVITADSLCIGCEYIATFHLKRDKSVIVTIFPVAIFTDTKTNERRLLFDSTRMIVPYELTKVQGELVCNSKLKCETQAVYRYIPEKVFTEFLLKFR